VEESAAISAEVAKLRKTGSAGSASDQVAIIIEENRERRQQQQQQQQQHSSARKRPSRPSNRGDLRNRLRRYLVSKYALSNITSGSSQRESWLQLPQEDAQPEKGKEAARSSSNTDNLLGVHGSEAGPGFLLRMALRLQALQAPF
jgi:hypothetical protein